MHALFVDIYTYICVYAYHIRMLTTSIRLPYRYAYHIRMLTIPVDFLEEVSPHI